MSSIYDPEHPENAPDSEIDVFSPETLREIAQCKQQNQSQFQSHWEMDENDIDEWSTDQIANDPAKQLISYAESGQLEQIKALFANKTSVEIEKLLMSHDSDGYTAMHRACYSNCVHVIKYLVSFEDNVDMPKLDQLNARTDMGWTPLHSAVYWNNFSSVEFLLKYANADVNIQTNSGQTCLHLAAQNSSTKETLLLLLSHPFIDFTLKNDQHEPAIEIARRSCKHYRLYETTENHLNKL